MFKGKEISLLTFSNFDPFDVPRSYFFVLNQENRKHHNWLQALEIAKFVNVTRKLGNSKYPSVFRLQSVPPFCFQIKLSYKPIAGSLHHPCHRRRHRHHVRRRTVASRVLAGVLAGRKKAHMSALVAREQPIFVPGSRFFKQVQTRQTKVRTGDELAKTGCARLTTRLHLYQPLLGKVARAPSPNLLGPDSRESRNRGNRA